MLRTTTKRMFLDGEYGAIVSAEHTGQDKQWRREREAINCTTCHDELCKFRNKDERYPVDAGGESQCLRWAQEFGGICWRNPDGTVILVPDKIVEAIRGT